MKTFSTILRVLGHALIYGGSAWVVIAAIVWCLRHFGVLH